MVMALASRFSDSQTPMSEADFILWQRLIEEKTGLWIPAHRKSFLLTQISSRVRAKGLDSYRSYYERLLGYMMDRAEWATLIDLLTVHETRFFRDNNAMDLVGEFTKKHIEQLCSRANDARSEVTRDILSKRRSSCVMQYWSVGCATGEEVYSLAMLLEDLTENLDKNETLYFGVRGTDISFPSLTDAREGKYSASKVRHIPDSLKNKYLISSENDNFQISDRIKERVCFVQENLGEMDTIPFQTFDVIYCQNVLIYFKPERKKLILDQLVDRLNRDGLLVLAPGEATNWQHAEMSRYPHSQCLAFIKNSGQSNTLRRNYGQK